MPQLILHGPPGLLSDAGRPLPLSAREAGLLAWLHAEGPTTRARIAGLLWPGGTEAQARANLRQLLVRLRRGAGGLIADAEGQLRLADGVLVADPGERLLLDGLAYDDAPEFAQWVAGRREAAARERQRGWLARGRESLERADLDTALAAADALLAEQPENEEAWRLRMEVLNLRGDRAAAIAAWDACKEALRTAFGIAPSAATQALGQTILAAAHAPLAGSVTPAALPAALRRPLQLVGRAALLTGMGRALALGRSLVVSGPGGIGKSRVLQQLAAAWAPALRVAARPGDKVLAGGLLAQLLDVALSRFAPALDEATTRDVTRLRASSAGGTPDVATALRSDGEHRRALDAAARALAVCHRSGLRLLVIDDLHYADSASLVALQFLLGRWLAASEPFDAADGSDGGDMRGPQVLLGARVDELGPAGQALIDAVAGHAGGERIELATLDAPALQALLDTLPLGEMQRPRPSGATTIDTAALAQALHARVGGNPAFVLEALRSLWLDGFDAWQPGEPLPVPASLRESVRARVGRLPEEALQLAQLAAVAQGDFDPALAAAALGRPALALAPLFAALERAQVFHASGFSHDLVAEAVQRSLPSALLNTLHRLVADHLAAHGGVEARIAHHLVAAGDPRAAVPWQLKAAAAARLRWQLADAADTGAAAARCLQAHGERAAALDAWFEALRCWISVRRLDAVADALPAILPLLRGPEDHARWRAREVRWLFLARRLADATAAAAPLVDQLAAAADRLTPDEAVFGLRAACLVVQNGLPAAPVLALCERIRPLATDAGGEVLAGFALGRATVLHWVSQPREASAELAAAWPSLGEASDPELRCAVANQWMRVRHALGELDGAISLAVPLLGWLREARESAVVEADVLHILGMMQVANGQAAAGFARFAAMEARLAQGGEAMREAFAMSIALACLAVGRLDEAAAWLDRHSRPLGRPGHGLYDQALSLARARLASARGEAVAHWTTPLAALPPLPAGVEQQRRVVLAGLQAQPWTDLMALRAELLAQGQAGLLRSVELACARAALARSDDGAAVGHARAALALRACVDAWSDEPATVWKTAGEVLTAAGAPDEGRAAWQAGARWVEAGARQWTDPAHRAAWLGGNPVHRALLAAAG